MVKYINIIQTIFFKKNKKFLKKSQNKNKLFDEKSKQNIIKEGTIRIAKQLKKMGFKIEDIEKATKLSKDEIEKL